MLRRHVILIGILGFGLPRFFIDIAAAPAIGEPQFERQPGAEKDAAAAVEGRTTVAPAPRRDPRLDLQKGEIAASATDRSVTIAVRRADCGCGQPPAEITMASRALSVRLLDSTALLPEIRDAVADEIVRFWGGQRTDVHGSVQADSTGKAETIYVHFRPGTAPARAGSPREGAGRPDDAPLAWTLFRETQPVSVIFVWVGAVQRLLDASSIEGRPLTHWHTTLRRALLARALGRVAAHEIGHLICGRLHAPGGLMKRRFTTDDLLWSTARLGTNGPHGACGHVTPR
jgi:hypothetical protein